MSLFADGALLASLAPPARFGARCKPVYFPASRILFTHAFSRAHLQLELERNISKMGTHLLRCALRFTRMRQASRSIGLVLVIAFAAWSAASLHADLARMSFAPVLRSWNVVLLAVILSLFNYILRIVRWRGYLGRLGFVLSPGFTAATYLAGFAFTLSPGKLGEIMRARYYSEAGIPVADVAGAFCVERLLDVLAMLVLSALMLTAFPNYRAAVVPVAVLVASTLAALIWLPWSWVPSNIFKRAAAGVAKAMISARALLRPEALLAGFLLGLAAWGCEGLGLYVLASMFPAEHLAPSVGVGIYAVAVLLGALSFLPGGLGSTEAVMTTLLTLRGFPIADALLITMICRLVTLWFAVFLGWIAVLSLRRRPLAEVETRNFSL